MKHSLNIDGKEDEEEKILVKQTYQNESVRLASVFTADGKPAQPSNHHIC